MITMFLEGFYDICNLEIAGLLVGFFCLLTITLLCFVFIINITSMIVSVIEYIAEEK